MLFSCININQILRKWHQPSFQTSCKDPTDLKRMKKNIVILSSYSMILYFVAFSAYFRFKESVFKGGTLNPNRPLIEKLRERLVIACPEGIAQCIYDYIKMIGLRVLPCDTHFPNRVGQLFGFPDRTCSFSTI